MNMNVAAESESSNHLAASQSLSSLPVTALIFAVISVVLYMWLLKPLLSPGEAPHLQTPPAMRDPVRPPQLPRGRQQQQPAMTRRNDTSDMTALLRHNARLPPHMAPSSAKYLDADTGGISLLSEGLLPFRHGRAAAFEQAIDSNALATNRKDRARVLSRVLSLDGASGSPPARGSTVVICILGTDIGCPRLRRALYLLATHFNTCVILTVAVGTTDGDMDELVTKLRGANPTDLPCEVLPRHRIVGAQTIAGRIAFVRQLGRVEFVLDHDEDMRTQLGRFGFRVLVYGDGHLGNGSVLGNALLA